VPNRELDTELDSVFLENDDVPLGNLNLCFKAIVSPSSRLEMSNNNDRDIISGQYSW
jgi:hypothetical protein